MGTGATCLKPAADYLIGGIELSEAQVQDVRDSWQLVVEAGADRVGIIAFKGLFVSAPETFQLFHSFNTIENWQESRQYRHHCAVVVKVIGYIVKVLCDPELLEKNMDYMGMRHSLFEIHPHHFDTLGVEIIKAFEELLGDRFTASAKEGWVLVYTAISNKLQTHLESYNKEFAYERMKENEKQNKARQEGTANVVT
jgi:hemoglobin-like flavoprotein